MALTESKYAGLLGLLGLCMAVALLLGFRTHVPGDDQKAVAGIEPAVPAAFYSMDGRLIRPGSPDAQRMMLVLTGERAAEIRGMSPAALAGAMDRQPWDIVTLPTPEMISGMERVFAGGQSREAGFVIGAGVYGDIRTSRLVESSGRQIDLGPAIRELTAAGYQVLSGVHSHPTGYSYDAEAGKLTWQADYRPSSSCDYNHEQPGDFENQAVQLARGIFKESSIVLGQETRPVIRMTFYQSTRKEYDIRTEQMVTWYGDSPDKKLTIPFRELQELSRKIYAR